MIAPRPPSWNPEHGATLDLFIGSAVSVLQAFKDNVVV